MFIILLRGRKILGLVQQSYFPYSGNNYYIQKILTRKKYTAFDDFIQNKGINIPSGEKRKWGRDIHRK